MHIKFVIALKNWKRQLFKRNMLSTIFINFFPKRNRLHFNSPLYWSLQFVLIKMQRLPIFKYLIYRNVLNY